MTPIRAMGLSKRFRKLRALEDLELEVPQGAVYALVGANGAGKTTAIKTLMNIHAPSAGRAEVLGRDSRRLGPAEFARIGYVSENQQMPEWMRVGDYLDFCRPFYPRWDAGALVHQFQLPLDRKLGQLSRGMRMKAALVSSLAYGPELIVLDEPFTGLDALVRDELIEGLLERIEGAAVLISSHDLAEVETFASHAGYLENGRLRFSEEMDSLGARFREVTVTLGAAQSAEWPAEWLNPEWSGPVVRFVDSRYESERTAERLRAMFADIREIEAEAMPLRAIFVALAKAARPGGARE